MFAVSVALHAAVAAALLFLAPPAVLRSVVFVPRETLLVAPPGATPAPARRATPRPPPLQSIRREARLFAPPPAAPARAARPDLQAPAIQVPEAAVPLPLLPTPAAPAPPAVAAHVFAGAAVPILPPVTVARPVRSAGFDQGAALPLPSAAKGNPVAASGFEQAAASPQARRASSLQMGSFGQAGAVSGGVRAARGRIGGAGFDQPAAAAPATTRPPAVRKTAFDEGPPAAAPAAAGGVPPRARVSPVEILDKPKPAYPEEARLRRVKGTVLLDVVFTAGGQVRVLGVVRGLGYGLDEAAAEAARKIAFKPAVEGGHPVDQRATLHVVFETTD